MTSILQFRMRYIGLALSGKGSVDLARLKIAYCLSILPSVCVFSTNLQEYCVLLSSISYRKLNIRCIKVSLAKGYLQ